MTKELRRLSIIVLFMFLSLFVATSWIQVVNAPTLNEDVNNRRTLYDSYEVQRGSIIAGGEEIVTSIASDDLYAWQRQYANADVWSTVTGWINPVLQSTEGLERAMNQELSGQASSAFFSRIDQILSGQDPRGSSIELSLEPAAQQAAYDALVNRGYTGAVVAVEPSTGRILAMVSTPGYDTNQLALHDGDAVNANYTALEADALEPLQNRAIAGDLYPPGSTFKLVTATAAIASGDYTMDSTFPNVAAYTLPSSSAVVSNADGGTCGSGDTVTLRDAIRLSCNVPMAELAVELGEDAIREAAESYGFNRSFETPLPSTASSYPSLAGDDAQTGLTGFGQGQVTATPLQMAMVAAGIANDGVVMNPWMVDDVIGPDLSVQETYDPTAFGEALDADLADALTEAMTASVQDGAATNARIDGVDVAGKTGTAENADDDPYTLWFTGFAPADDPQVAVAVVVEDGGGQGQSGSGNTIAAPIAKEVMEAVLAR
ncbi:penicillin-binding protein 2 [Microbacterium betulae]|uniref:Penicillin-binding protein 2 n=1 Tax=Microbacterium betulae TaxID=2981139 RepID=A0AA97I6Y3_9MICO|nr:penicillin-binding protein 2 [Microbacterium sp. AB]WOF23102.1 penicillin-binding protein 2 [Microbacterium sp. AB]